MHLDCVSDGDEMDAKAEACDGRWFALKIVDTSTRWAFETEGQPGSCTCALMVIPSSAMFVMNRLCINPKNTMSPRRDA